MANVTPIKLNGNFHSPFVAGDTIDSALLKIVSTDAGNDISVGSDGAAFIDLDGAAMVEKIQDAVGNALQSPLVYDDLLNQISSTAISSVAVGAGLSGTGLSGSPIVPDFDSLPASAAGNLPAGTKFVISGGNGELATSAQLSQAIASDVQSNLVKGDLVAGTNVSFTGTATGRLLGSGNLTIDVSGAAPTGTAGGDLNGSYPNPTIKANVELAGIPTTPTATLGTNTTQIANTAFVANAIANLIASSPAALDTLNELAAALGNDANFSTTITTALGLKAPLASPALTGTPTVPTATLGTNTTQAASTAFVAAGLANLITTTLGGDSAFATTNSTNLGLKAPLASPSFTGVPTVPTAANGTNTTQAASTAFVAAGYQPLDSGLTAIAALSTTSYGRNLLTLANQAALQSAVGAATTGKAIAMAIVFGG